MSPELGSRLEAATERHPGVDALPAYHVLPGARKTLRGIHTKEVAPGGLAESVEMLVGTERRRLLVDTDAGLFGTSRRTAWAISSPPRCPLPGPGFRPRDLGLVEDQQAVLALDVHDDPLPHEGEAIARSCRRYRRRTCAATGSARQRHPRSNFGSRASPSCQDLGGEGMLDLVVSRPKPDVELGLGRLEGEGFDLDDLTTDQPRRYLSLTEETSSRAGGRDARCRGQARRGRRGAVHGRPEGYVPDRSAEAKALLASMRHYDLALAPIRTLGSTGASRSRRSATSRPRRARWNRNLFQNARRRRFAYAPAGFPESTSSSSRSTLTTCQCRRPPCLPASPRSSTPPAPPPVSRRSPRPSQGSDRSDCATAERRAPQESPERRGRIQVAKRRSQQPGSGRARSSSFPPSQSGKRH